MQLSFRTNPGNMAALTEDFVGIDTADVPMKLFGIHRSVEPGSGGVLSFSARGSDTGRLVELSHQGTIEALVEGAGFSVAQRHIADSPEVLVRVSVTRERTLSDSVGPSMRVLLSGLNPSVTAADLGFGFASPSNRFWKAALASGLVSVAKQPAEILRVDRVGMTDLAKRATPRASEVNKAEFVSGLARIDRMVALLEPRIVCVVGITGWRAATGEPAELGLQPSELGGRPVYVMPNPSGLNAHTNHEDLVQHFREVLAIADSVDGGHTDRT